MNSLLDFVIEQTSKFLIDVPKSTRKEKGQFFTSKETAIYMASLFNFKNDKEEISLLDPGSGTGILTAAFIERIQQETSIKIVNITCYEIDDQVIPILEKNLNYINENSTIEINYQIKTEDYLLSQTDEYNGHSNKDLKEEKYDYVIGNPPYLKLTKNNPSALQMKKIVYGAPNLYFLFADMSLFNLKSQGELVYIIPRSWTSGLYFRAFRKHFLTNGKIECLHLFVSRDKVFSYEKVLQETMIMKIVKTQATPRNIKITTSKANHDFEDRNTLDAPYNSIVSGENFYVFLPTSNVEIDSIKLISKFNNTFSQIGLKMKTGIVVDFRQKEQLSENKTDDTVPLFYSQHIQEGQVLHAPSGKGYDWLFNNKQGLLQKNKNYVFCKRFTAKEETRRLQCGIYLANNFKEYTHIATQNKLNFVEDINGNDLSKDEVYGIYTLLNSTLYDTYYRVLNGSTQVNSTEINNFPVPPREAIIKMGKLLIKSKELSTEVCDKIMYEVTYG